MQLLHLSLRLLFFYTLIDCALIVPINIGNPGGFTSRQLVELVRAKVNPDLELIEKLLLQDVSPALFT